MVINTVQSTVTRLSLPLIVILALASCATMERPSEKAEPTTTRPRAKTRSYKRHSAREVMNKLDLELASDELGLAEKPFNPCKIGESPNRSGRCGNHYLGHIRFRIQCRDTVGTVSEIARILSPPSSKRFRWTIRQHKGVVRVDSEGYGTILLRSPLPIGPQRLKLSDGTDFLALRVRDVSRIIVPRYWCK